jgi:hypothetical protein
MTTAVDARRFVRAFAAPIRCQKCSDWMIAPVSSEFVVGGEIRHHWECDSCGDVSSTSLDIPLERETLLRETCAA